MADDGLTSKEQLIALLHRLSVKRGEFVLASGKTSDLYLDVRQTTLHAEGARLVAELVLDRISPQVQAIGGPTLGADPVVCSAVAWSTVHLGRPLHGFLVRKEEKGHGTGRWIEGLASVPEGTAVCVVEDTTTTGGSLLRAVERVQQAGLRVVQCLTVVDRQEGARQRMADAGIGLDAIITREDLGV